MRPLLRLRRLEEAWDAARHRRHARRPPAHFRIVSYGGHGSTAGLVLRGRTLDDPPLSRAVEGERVGQAVRRTVRGFLTDELAGVPLRITVAGQEVCTTTDPEGYFAVRLGADAPAAAGLEAPWTTGTVALDGAHLGLTGPHATAVRVRASGAEAAYGVISDIDDTVLETGVQQVARMVWQTLTGSAVTRRAFPGAAELYRDLADGARNPVFYVSSSPWNLHDFITDFLAHRGFPEGPVLLRDLLGGREGREDKHRRIHEVLDLHPDLPFVLIGDSGEKDPEIYAEVVRSRPGRVLAVYIREVRLDPGDGRVEQVTDAWQHETPFVLVPDSDALREHATALGLLDP